MPVQKTQEWLDFRKKVGFTGSEINDVLGIGFKKKSGKIDLLKRKCGIQHAEFRGNEATAWGEAYEDEAISEYEKLTGAKVYPLNMIQHPTFDFLCFSPDGVACFYDENDNILDLRLIEVKCPIRRKIVLVDGVAQVPDYYKFQPQLGLDILYHLGHMTSCDFIQYIPHNEAKGYYKQEIYVTNIPYDEEKWDEVFPVLVKTWDQIQNVRQGLMTFDELMEANGLTSRVFDTSRGEFTNKWAGPVDKPMDIRRSLFVDDGSLEKTKAKSVQNRQNIRCWFDLK